MKTTEEKIEALYSSLPSLRCKKLCQECCGPIGMSTVEYDRIQREHGAIFHAPLMSERLVITQCLACTALKDGRCSIYAMRPAICRLWGLVQKMRCPHGCTPERWVSDSEAHSIMDKLARLSA